MGLKEIISKIEDGKADLIAVERDLAEARSKSKHGLQDILSKRATLVKSRINSYMNKFNNLGQGTILEIQFRVIEEKGFELPKEYIHYYINITKEEGEYLLTYWASTKGFKIEILESKELNTLKSYKKL